MNKFKFRSNEVELLDSPDIQRELIFKNLNELNFINRVLGGDSISLMGIKKLVTDKNRTYHIIDLGSGGGGVMQYIADWARKEGYTIQLTGVDKNADTIDFLNEHYKNYPEIKGVACDYTEYLRTGVSVDIVHCSLFCHHLKDNELIDLLRNIKNHAETGFVINDLHRHRITYWGVYLITRLFNGSKLSKNDGPVSVLRAFKRKEIKLLLNEARFQKYIINWKWAFRYLIVGYC